MREHSESEANTPAPLIPRYDIRSLLGEGSGGVVWRAWDRELQRPVALKVFRVRAGAEESAPERFRREALATARLRHPHVVTVYDRGVMDGKPYLVLELVEGEPLSQVLRSGRLDLRARLELLEKAARGIASAHALDIVHRDLKPANILVDGEDSPKVADFGLARTLDEETRLTRSGVQIGTPVYMAPEQIRSEAEVTPRTDVYALGAILYEMLTGRPPHEAKTLHGLYAAILGEDPIPPRKKAAGVPRDAETVCLKALSKDPAARYENAAEFADDLGRVLGEEPVRARRPGLVRRASWWIRQRPGRAVAVALLLSAAFVGALDVWREDEARRHLSNAVDRALESGRSAALQRLLLLKPERLAAALREEGSDALRDELRQLQPPLEFLALESSRKRVVFAQGPADLCSAVQTSSPKLVSAQGRLWLTAGKAVQDLGMLWTAQPLDTSWLSSAVDPALGRVAWSDPDGRLIAASATGSLEQLQKGHRSFVLEVPRDPSGYRRHLLTPRLPVWGDGRVAAIVLALLAVGVFAASRRAAVRS